MKAAETPKERDYFTDPIQEGEDYYSILGIQKEAAYQNIVGAYQKLALKYNPKTNEDLKAADVSKKIEEAFIETARPHFVKQKKYLETYAASLMDIEQYPEAIKIFDKLINLPLVNTQEDIIFLRVLNLNAILTTTILNLMLPKNCLIK